MSPRPPYLAARLRGLGTTVFAEMSALADATDSINLGQGFPDEDGPDEVADAAVEAIRAGVNQYPPGPGRPELRAAIAGHQARFYGIELDADHQVLVTAGATEAITAAIIALCEPGDEVLCFEPFYDSYTAAIAMAGAERRTVTLQPPDWSFDPERLARAVTPRTRLLLLNSPHNPTGKVFSDEELQAIASICCERDLLVVTDEVYEHLIFDGHHRPISTLPGMAERTVTVSSAGKTFSFTGWKIGWVTGPADLVTAVRTVKQFLTYVNGAPFQPAVATGLALPDSYFSSAAWTLREKRDLLCAGLIAAGFAVHVPAATYFVMVDTGPLGFLDGAALCREMPHRCGVVAVPAAAFYSDPSAPTPLVRFAFCKRPEVLDEAVRRLAGLRRS
ncbi:MAG TPA: pyridoxal phosphate-dependent aminotransferase [Acidimicrobiales bacterium]|jgi:N-succinyldiaminopimelate aminotransferase|nr:pyridoxal phosphate-dependent aminotransferase [Acidimicrobiales bacterium]